MYNPGRSYYHSTPLFPFSLSLSLSFSLHLCTHTRVYQWSFAERNAHVYALCCIALMRDEIPSSLDFQRRTPQYGFQKVFRTRRREKRLRWQKLSWLSIEYVRCVFTMRDKMYGQKWIHEHLEDLSVFFNQVFFIKNLKIDFPSVSTFKVMKVIRESLNIESYHKRKRTNCVI